MRLDQERTLPCIMRLGLLASILALLITACGPLEEDPADDLPFGKGELLQAKTQICSEDKKLCFGGTVSVSSSFSNWSENLDADWQGAGEASDFTSCRFVEELSATIICGSTQMEDMNWMLTRASIFAEGGLGLEAGTVVSLLDPRVEEFVENIAGHDLTKAVLMDFYAEASRQCKLRGDDYCLNNLERRFFETVVLPAAEKLDQFVVLTFPGDVIFPGEHSFPKLVMSHEILHAQYFLDEDYRRRVDQYWGQLPEEVHREIRDIFSADYDVTNEFLMINEFQAYLLELDCDQSYLMDFVDDHRDALIAYLAEKGLQPIQIN